MQHQCLEFPDVMKEKSFEGRIWTFYVIVFDSSTIWKYRFAYYFPKILETMQEFSTTYHTRENPTVPSKFFLADKTSAYQTFSSFSTE